jgi:hypothetical protein
MIVSPLLQILAIYVGTSLAAGLPLGFALGVMIRRVDAVTTLAIYVPMSTVQLRNAGRRPTRQTRDQAIDCRELRLWRPCRLPGGRTQAPQP